MLVAGVDSSTQSTKVLLCRADDGAIIGQASAPHPDGTECDPELWWDALVKAGAGLLDRADAIGVAAQQGSSMAAVHHRVGAALSLNQNHRAFSKIVEVNAAFDFRSDDAASNGPAQVSTGREHAWVRSHDQL